MAAGTFFYTYASTCPFTSIAAVLRSSPLCRLLFRLIHFLVSIVADLAVEIEGNVLALAFDSCLEVPQIEGRLQAVAAVVIALAPLGAPYIKVYESPKAEWDYSCDGFDGTISLHARGILVQGLSYAQFPPSMGGEKRL